MFEAYSVGVTLKLHNLISPQLALLASEFEKFDKLTLTLNKSLGKIAVDSKGLRSLTTATDAANRAFERANVTAAAFRNHLASIHQSGGAIGVAALGGSASRAPRLPPAGGGGGSGGGRGRAGAGGFHGGNVHMGAGGVSLGTVGMAAGDWFVPLAVTGAMIYAGKSLLESAKALDTEKNRFRQFGMTEAQNQEAFNYAKRLNIYGTTQTERLAAFRESQGVFRESGLDGSAALAGAKLATPILSKLDFLAASLDDESRAKMHTANLAMLRYVESSGGLKSAEEFNRIADFGYKLNVSSGGTVNWEQLRQFKARAGAAGFHLTDDAMARLEPVIAEMKGGAVGFGLSTAFNRLAGATRLPNQIAHELADNGIWDKSKILWNQAGGVKGFTDAGGPLSKDKIEMLSTNPELFYERYIKPMYDHMKLDSAEIARQNVMIFGSTGGRNMTLIDNQMANIHASIEALKKTMGITESFNKGGEWLSGEEEEFGAAWTDFKTQFGTTMLPFFTGILKGGADLLRIMGHDVKDDHPNQHFVSRFKGKGGGMSGGQWVNDEPSPYIAGKDAASVKLLVQLNADAEKMGLRLTEIQSKSVAAPQTGISMFDNTQSLIPAGGLGY